MTLDRETGLESYRGLSGLDSALFVAAAASVSRGGPGRARAAALTALIALAAKITFEAATGQAIFVDEAARGFSPVPLAHAVGAAAGGLAAWCKWLAPRDAARTIANRDA